MSKNNIYFKFVHVYLIMDTVLYYTDVGYSQPQFNNGNIISNHVVVSKLNSLSGPQVIDVIMRKPGKITIISAISNSMIELFK